MQDKHTKQPKIRSVKFNVVMNMILTTSSFIFPLITVPYVSRVLGPSGTGIVAWIQTLITYFSLVAVLGITTYGVRACAEVRDDREKLSQVTQELMTILVISTAIVYAIYLIFIFTIPKTREYWILSLIFSVGIWLTSCGCNWFYQAIEQYGYITIRNILFKVMAIVLMFVLVRSVNDYVWYGVTTVIGGYGSNVFNLIRLRKFVDFKINRKLNLKRHFKPMISFTISSISSGMYSQMDMLLSGFFLSNALVGIYQMVVKIKQICYAAVNSVGSVMLPRISYYEAQQGHENSKKLIGKNLNFIMIVGFGLITILTICGRSIIEFLGGNQYVSGSLALALISPTMLLSATNTTLSQYLIAVKREKEYAAVNFAALVCGVILGCILIPKFGVNGAAGSVVLCELFALILRCILLRSFIIELRHEIDGGKIFAAALLTFGILWIIHQRVFILPSLLQLVVEGFVFGVLYAALLLLFRERFIRQIIFRRNRL